MSELSAIDPRTDRLPSNVTITDIRELIDEERREAAADGRSGSHAGEPAGKGTPDAPDKTTASTIIESIGRDFVALRAEGRSQAWADLEDRLMQNAHILISAGLMNPKDWIGLAIDIEQFRKQDLGTTQLPGDFLKTWLSEPIAIQAEVPTPHMPKREKKTKKAVKA